MGMTNWVGCNPDKTDSEVAKSYLDEQELGTLNRLVNFYLEFAELQAISRKPMYMADWIRKLDDFMKLSGREILSHTGKISHAEAIEKAHSEYARYKREQLAEPSRVELDFLDAVKSLEKSGKPS